MEHTKINHSPLITAIENFVEDTIDCTEPWEGYWTELADLLRELQEQYDLDLNYSAYNQAMIELMLDLEQKIESEAIDGSVLTELSFKDVQSLFDKYEKRHQREVQRFKEDELKNRCKAMEYTELLFEHYSRLAVIRVDLSYRQDQRRFIDIADFRKDIRKLLDRLQDKDCHFRDLEGYVYALEQGAQKGYHAHFLLFYDGSRIKFHRHIADCIIGTWKKITGEAGQGYNCNTKQNRKSYLERDKDALGTVNRGDHAKRLNVLQIVRYFTEPSKTEQYLRVRVKNMQTFGHGKFNRPSRRGIAETINRVKYDLRLEEGRKRPKRELN